MPDLVPAPLPSGLPDKPSDLDGWDVADLTGWLDENMPVLATMERRTDEARLSIGLVLWKLRDELTESAFGIEARRLAAAAKVDIGTLRRWRKYAQDQRGLGAPSGAAARSDGQVRARARTSGPRKPVEASAQQVPNADLLVGLDPAPVPSGAQTAPAPAPGGNSPRPAPPTDRPASAELGEGALSPPQEPSAPTVSGKAAPLPEAPPALPEALPPGELVARLLRFKPDRLAGVDGPSLRSLLALVRGALEAQAARAKPAASPAGVDCPHPKAKRKSFGYVTICEACGQKV